MTTPSVRLRLVLALASLTLASAARAREVPFLSGRVVDEAAMISPAAEAAIEARLAAIEQAKGAQFAVLTVADLGGEPIEDYAHRVAETWKLGRAEQDDGLLLLIARDDRQMRFEVGYGLEGDLTDLETRRILDGIVRPAFRAGDFDAGIGGAVEAVAAKFGVQGAVAPAITSAAPAAPEHHSLPLSCGVIFFGLVVLILVFKLALLHRRRGWWQTMPHGRPDWRAGSDPGPIVWGGGRSGGGWGGGGSSSGGGFSGGGGSFGGGGSSSSW